MILKRLFSLRFNLCDWSKHTKKRSIKRKKQDFTEVGVKTARRDRILRERQNEDGRKVKIDRALQ